MPDIKYFSNVQSKSTGDVYVVKDEGAREQIDDIYKYNGEMGAKNLIPFPYYRSNGYVHREVTYTVDSKGKITANGTATDGNSYFEIRNNSYEQYHLKSNTHYIISGCPSGGGDSTYSLVVTYKIDGGSAITLASDFGNGAEFTTPQNENANYTIAVKIISGIATTNLLFEPMLRLAVDTDDTYQPYAKTNRQLTEDVSVPKYNSTGEYIYYEGGDQFTGKIDSAPTAGSSNAVSSGGTKTYVDNALSSIGAFRPCGTVTFANLPVVSTVLTGDMYNISDSFTTTADFKEGAGHSISAGANVYKTADGMWDILAGVTVTGVKGDKEQNYRQGNINLTPANIGAVPEPSTEGSNGQVLATDGQGGRSWQSVQSSLTFDNVPTQNSNNPVKSGGIFSTMAVPKYDATNRREYFEGGAAFDGNIDSTPTAGSNNAVASGGTKTYVDNAVSTGISDVLSLVDTTKIKTVKLNKNQSATISANIRDYWAMMAVCYIPGEGGRLLGFVYHNGTGEVKNLWNGNTFSSSYVDFTFSSTGLTVTAKNYNGYVFSFIVTPPAAS